jgi:spore coat polysaccharide biosynthesis predicted glycosyltransferase SpsG
LTLAIFTEGDVSRGLGHISRCSAYAALWRQCGGRVAWIVDGDQAAARALAGESHVTWAKWQDGPHPPGGMKADVAIVDSYSAPENVLAVIAEQTRFTVYIDDLERVRYAAGLVVHSAPGEVRDTAGAAVWATGPAWHPMRLPFWDVAPRGEPARDVKRVLVLMGGTDLHSLTAPMAGFASRHFPGAEVDAVLGAGSDHDAALPGGTRLHRALNAEAMRDLMLSSDLCISAAGQTLYELARCGVPTVAIGVAENQKRHMRAWPETGAMLAAGWWDDPDLIDRTRDCMISLADPEARRSASGRGQATVDGQGTRRALAYVSKRLT